MKAQLFKVIRKPAKMQIRVKEIIITDTNNKSSLLGFYLCLGFVVLSSSKFVIRFSVLHLVFHMSTWSRLKTC